MQETTSELALSIDKFSEQYLQPAIRAIAKIITIKRYKKHAMYSSNKRQRRLYRKLLRTTK